MDFYIEELVKKNKEAKDYILTALMVFGGIIFSIVLFFALLLITPSFGAFSQIVGSLGLLLIAGIWYLVYLLNGSRSVEYEYIVINSSLDIDKITAKKRRKKMLEIDIKDASIMACIDDELNNAVYKNLNGTKIRDYSAKSKNLNTYFIEYSSDGGREIVLFQPTSKMVDALWQFNPRAVKKYEV